MLPALLPLIGGVISGAANLIGGKMASDATKEANTENAETQREFAQNGIRWKVADAKAAGLHPLAALGAQTTAFSPSYVGDTGLGEGVASAGQDIGRAVAATETPDERIQSFNRNMMALQLERGTLENQLLRSQIMRSMAGSGNPMAAVVSPSSDPKVNDLRTVAPTLYTTPAGVVKMLPPGITPAQDMEDLFGEMYGDLHGAGNAMYSVQTASEGRRGTYDSSPTRYFTGGGF